MNALAMYKYAKDPNSQTISLTKFLQLRLAVAACLTHPVFLYCFLPFLVLPLVLYLSPFRSSTNKIQKITSNTHKRKYTVMKGISSSQADQVRKKEKGDSSSLRQVKSMFYQALPTPPSSRSPLMLLARPAVMTPSSSCPMNSALSPWPMP